METNQSQPFFGTGWRMRKTKETQKASELLKKPAQTDFLLWGLQVRTSLTFFPGLFEYQRVEIDLSSGPLGPGPPTLVKDTGNTGSDSWPNLCAEYAN